MESFVGKKFHKLTVISYLGTKITEKERKRRRINHLFHCQCDCGNFKTIEKYQLGRTKSCGCEAKRVAAARRIDLTDRRAGNLTVIRRSRKEEIAQFKKEWQRNSYSYSWYCRCDCGNHIHLSTSRLAAAIRRDASQCAKSVVPCRSAVRSCGCRRGDFHRLPGDQAAFNRFYGSYVRSTRGGSISFNLTKDEFRNLTKQKCFYCDIPPSMSFKPNSCSKKSSNRDYICNGIDRVDNDKGYSVENSVPCCRTCNFIKSSMTVNELFHHLEKIVQHQKSNQDSDPAHEQGG